MGVCVICGGQVPGARALTCSDVCHERLVASMEGEYGAVKRIVRESTGEAFAVPIRDIIERGVSERDLDGYQRWWEYEEEQESEKQIVTVTLHEEDLRELLRGNAVRKGGAAIILADIGMPRVRDVIFEEYNTWRARPPGRG